MRCDSPPHTPGDGWGQGRGDGAQAVMDHDHEHDAEFEREFGYEDRPRGCGRWEFQIIVLAGALVFAGLLPLLGTTTAPHRGQPGWFTRPDVPVYASSPDVWSACSQDHPIGTVAPNTGTASTGKPSTGTASGGLDEVDDDAVRRGCRPNAARLPGDPEPAWIGTRTAWARVVCQLGAYSKVEQGNRDGWAPSREVHGLFGAPPLCSTFDL
ncbi:hypothetical protein PSU4_40170 [Pseudonocardia sulfidoxydans NBRC 16205]|uniref:Uncharacterized protein n=1 Tax=Pseudonocardia sulfidoxydans NBRC 16205 TaxID=1223511 RepID=A0A511DLB7_9PSEU|nr:hypothetical protein PSU4_40170 [Pseudonocardia sulfidoxydans NBRC 16205]